MNRIAIQTLLHRTVSLLASTTLLLAPAAFAGSRVSEQTAPVSLEQAIEAQQLAEKLRAEPPVFAAPAVETQKAPAVKAAPNPRGVVGPVRVTATAGTVGPTDYATLGAAVAAINAGTHQGDITVSILGSVVESGPVVLNGNSAAPASYTSVSIRPGNDAVTVSGATATGRGLIELNGASSVTIDGDNPNTTGTHRDLTLQNTAASTVTFTSVVRIALATAGVNTANNNTIQNLNIIGSSPGRNISTATSTAGTENTTFGIFAGPGGATPAPTAITSVTTGVGAGATANNLQIANNIFTGSMARAISINGAAATVFGSLQVRNNIIGNAVAGSADQVTAIGITVNGATNALVSGNTVYVEGFLATSSATQGINTGVNSTNTTGTSIQSNKVSRARNNNPSTWSAMGINLGGGNSHVVVNNFVFDVRNDQTAGTGAFGTSFGAYGIRAASGTGHKVYHNSVHLFGTLPGTTSSDLTVAFVIVATSQTGMDVRDNIFSNQLTGGNATSTRHATVFLPSGGTTAMNLTWNNNDYDQGTSGAQSLLAQVGTTAGTGEYLASNFDPASTTPASNFRAYTSALGNTSNDSASKAVNPQFISDTELHLAMTSPMINMGVDVGVMTDIDNEARVFPPDIGADEVGSVMAAANDIAANGITSPANGSTRPANSPFAVSATFSNVGTATQTNVPVRFRIFNAMNVEVYNQTGTIPTIAPGQTVTVNFPSATLPAGNYTTRATAELPGDSNPANDEVSGTVSVRAPLSGTVNVGTGGDYASLTNTGGVFEAMNAGGIASNIVINITSDLTSETGAVGLNQPIETGVGNYTVTIRPTGAARIISGSAASTALVKFIGVSRVTVDGSLGGGGTDRSLTIENTSATSPSVILFGSVGTTPITTDTLKNCVIRNGANTSSAVVTSDSATLGGPGFFNNITIQNNSVQKAFIGVYTNGGTTPQGGVNLQYLDNDITSSGANAVRRVALYMQGVNGATVARNRIANLDPTSDEDDRAIWMATGTINAVADSNYISNLGYTGTGGYAGQGIVVSSGQASCNNRISNNMISNLTGDGFSYTGTSAGDNPFGIYAFSTQTGVAIEFNSINLYGNTLNQTSALSAGIALGTGTVADVIDNVIVNNLGVSAATGYGSVGIWLQTAASQLNTASNNDYFVSPTGNGAKAVGQIATTASPTVMDWQTATGKEANTKSVNPLFVAQTNLHLGCGSPVIGMAVAIAGITTDFDGQTRDSMPDMGADEAFAPTALSAVSRMTHGGAGTFDIALPGIESRSGGANGDYHIVVTFAAPVTFSGANVSSGAGMVSSTSGSGTNTVTVNLTGVSNAQYVTVTVNCANDGVNAGDVPITMGVLVGDVNGDGSENSADATLTRSLSGHTTDGTNFRADVNVDGEVNSADFTIVRARSGTGL